jgi:hypothetical protein
VKLPPYRVCALKGSKTNTEAMLGFSRTKEFTAFCAHEYLQGPNSNEGAAFGGSVESIDICFHRGCPQRAAQPLSDDFARAVDDYERSFSRSKNAEFGETVIA